MGTVLPNFPASPISEVQPFTYRDNESYLKQLHRLRNYVRENLQRLNNQEIVDIAALRDNLNTLSDALAADITNFETTINADIANYVIQLNAAIATANAAKAEADAATASQDSATAQNIDSGSLTPLALRSFNDIAQRSNSVSDSLKASTGNVGINILSSTRIRLHANVAANQVWYQDLAILPTGSYVGPSAPPLLMDAATIDHTFSAGANMVGAYTYADDSAGTYAGDTQFMWNNDVPQSLAYGGGYRYSNVNGASVSWTSPAGANGVNIRTVLNPNAGYALVQIDGDKTAAYLLPNAQQVVNSGNLPSTVLVANGGPLNPTDRLLDSYSVSQNYDAIIGLADNLTAGAHTIKITNLAMKRAAATDTRLYASGFGSASYAAQGSPILRNYTLFPQAKAYSAYEYALDIAAPDGSHDFVGNVHGYDTPSSISVYVDGALIDLTSITDHAGTSVTIVRDSVISSPHLTGDVANARVVYRLTGNGLEVRTRITFLQNCSLVGGYLAMYPADNSLSSGVIVGHENILDLTQGIGGASGSVRIYSQAAYVYNPVNGATCCMHIPDLRTVKDWQYSSLANGGMFIEDRAGNVINKIYAAIASSDIPQPIAAGEVLSGRTIYRAMVLPDPSMLSF